VQNVLVVDEAHSFIIQYDSHLEVYRINDVTLSQASAAVSSSN